MSLRFCLLACLLTLGLAFSPLWSVTTEENSMGVTDDSGERQEETDSYEQDDDDYNPYLPYGYFDPRTDGFPNIS